LKNLRKSGFVSLIDLLPKFFPFEVNMFSFEFFGIVMREHRFGKSN